MDPITEFDGTLESPVTITTGFGTDFTPTATNSSDAVQVSLRTRITSNTVVGRYIVTVRIKDPTGTLSDQTIPIKLDVVIESKTPER